MHLSALDETLLHQTALPFALAATSDHRFYDRFYLSTFAPDGGAAIIHGAGVYKNMNVIDGFAATLAGRTQRNRRFSRPLLPDLPGMDVTLGPIRYEVIEPFERVRFLVDPADGDGFDLTFEATFPPHLEEPHTSRTDGRLHTEYLRQSQFGRIDGSAVIAGEAMNVRDWFAWRDHSWGVRPGVGGFEPGRKQGGLASASRAGGLGMLMVFFSFQTPSLSCNVQVQEDETGKVYYSDGMIVRRDGSIDRIVRAEHDIAFRPGTRLFETARVAMIAESGRAYEMLAEAMGPPWVMRGAGYDGGYADGLGHGARRGDGGLNVEADVYDLSGGDVIPMPGGEPASPQHREQIARVTVDGEAGFAHAGIIVSGRNARYGFTA